MRKHFPVPVEYFIGNQFFVENRVMGRRRRRIESLRPYEMCFRARDTLPFVAYQVIDIIIKHALARAQRDDKLFLCHDIWNGSHCHIIVLTKDADQCKKFYMEVKKKITDCLKRLLGLDELLLWEQKPVEVALIADRNKAIRRIVYLYSNPAKDNLEKAIELFPGYSSYPEFLQAKDKEIDTEISEEVIRLRLPKIPFLRTRTPSPKQELRIIRKIEKDNTEMQSLVRHPNKWMSAYNISENEVSAINEEIEERLRRRERAAERLRRMTGKKVMGAKKLRAQPILKPHKPKKHGINIFYLGSTNRARIAFIAEFKKFCEVCKECYKEWLKGNLSVKWPPGAFKPPLPPGMNII